MKKVLPLVITAILVFSCDHEEEPLVSTLKGDLQSSIVLPLQENTCITSPFGWRKRGFHNGIDLRTERNCQVAFNLSHKVAFKLSHRQQKITP
ncbi:MAG: hypothetical protein ACOX2F_02640 [bacterium]